MLKIKRKAVTSIAALAVLASVFLNVVPAFAELMIMPIRTVFEGRDRMKNIMLVNTSTEPAIFRLELYYLKQEESGGYEKTQESTTPGYDMSKMIVFSPRQVELPPRGKQAVRLSLRRPESLPDGEYRVHMKMTRIASSNLKKPEKGAAVGLSVNVGFSVPIMLRQGGYDTQVKISDPKFVPPQGKQPASIRFYLNRTGKFSALGRTDIFWTPPGGEERKIGMLNGVTVYPEVSRREISVGLTEQSLSGGKIRIIYEGAEADKGKHFDEKVFDVAELLR